MQAIMERFCVCIALLYMGFSYVPKAVGLASAAPFAPEFARVHWVFAAAHFAMAIAVAFRGVR